MPHSLSNNCEFNKGHGDGPVCSNGLEMPKATRQASVQAVQAISLSCDGVEVTQAIQDMAHSVPLVAQKSTVVRVYLSANSSVPIKLRGVLAVRRLLPTGPWTTLASAGTAEVVPAQNGQLRPKRENLKNSINFVLPKGLCGAGTIEVKLSTVSRIDVPQTLVPPASATRKAKFVASAPLRVRVLGIRYQTGSPARTIAPTALDYSRIQSWLKRAYPVAEVIWSQVTVSAPSNWPFTAAQINAHIRGIRAIDVAAGLDARTHYYGLVADDGGANFMRGLASGIPSTPDPRTVASGPTGTGTFGWDNDGSYGDWYTGHELGHTFGRFHAEFCNATGGAPYPFANGQLSNADGAFVGFDFGDANQGLPMQALPGTVWHDVMSYCANQWLSSFTYNGIRDRLNRENALPSGAVPASTAGLTRKTKGKTMDSNPTVIHVVALVNLTQATGKIQNINPLLTSASNLLTPAAVGTSKRRTAGNSSNISILTFDGAGKQLANYSAKLIVDACRAPSDDETGTIDACIPIDSKIARIELQMSNQVLDTFMPGASEKAVKDVKVVKRSKSAGTRAAMSAMTSAEENLDPVITWDSGASATRSGALSIGGASPKYTVQISTDSGQSWQTVGFNQDATQIAIDHNLLSGHENILVRITTTNGISSSTSEKVIKVSELI